MRNEVAHCLGWGNRGFDHYLPFEPSVVDIEAAVTALKAATLVESDGPRLRFTGYPVGPSKIGTVHETTRKCYEPLVAIADVLQKLTLSDGREASCQFLQRLDGFNEAETYDANFKIDALLKLNRSTMPSSSVQSSSIPVAALAVPAEYRTDRNDVRENRERLLGTAAFCMNDDPRRKHIYGITFEDDMMAVWYFSRSHSAKSPDFRFTENCETYIRVMLSLMFATEEELGYDPTVQHRLDPGVNKLCFVYEVDGHYYKTQKAIFDNRSLCITGRATRVWEVIEVVSFDDLHPVEGSRTAVLKDVWLDEGSMTEGEIQREIFADLKKIADALKAGKEPEGFAGMDDDSKNMLRECLQEQDWDQYFLTPVREWKGSTSKEIAKAAEPDFTLFGAPPATTPWSSRYADLSRVSLSQPSDLLPHRTELFYRRHCPKRQYRVVFGQVCVALHDVPKLGDVLTAMISCVFALQLMFLAGWVHRDISSGNLYWFKDNDGEARGILGDLEYAKRFRPLDANGSADPKMGTAFFMAVEIQTQGHLYTPRESLDEMSKSEMRLVVHNYEHDMESMFWILIWTLLVRFPCNLDPKKRLGYEGTLAEIFQDTSICSSKRLHILNQHGTLRDLLTRFLAPELQSLQKALRRLRIDLWNGYLDRGYDSDKVSSYSPLYKSLRAALVECQELTQKRSLPELLPCRYHESKAAQAEIVHPPLQAGKRERSQSNAGEDDDEYSQVSKTARSTDATSARTVLKSNPVSYDEGEP